MYIISGGSSELAHKSGSKTFKNEQNIWADSRTFEHSEEDLWTFSDWRAYYWSGKHKLKTQLDTLHTHIELLKLKKLPTSKFDKVGVKQLKLTCGR